MRTIAVAALLVGAAVQGVWGQSPQKPPAAPVPRQGSAVRHGAPAAPKTSVRPAAPRPAPFVPRDAPPSPVLSPVPSARPVPSSPFDAGPFTYAPRYRTWDGLRPPRNFGSGYYGYTIPYEIVETTPNAAPPDLSADQLASGGSLLLEVEPRTAEVFVDGFYVGTVNDVMQNGVLLRAGRHWIDLRAAGYETLTVPVSVQAGQAVRYRGELLSSRAASPAAEPARGPQTMYVITGCYAGNKPPIESVLPAGCDISKLRTLTP